MKNPFNAGNIPVVPVRKVRAAMDKNYLVWRVQFKTKKGWFWKDYGCYRDRENALAAAAKIYERGFVDADAVSSVEATLS